MKKKRIYTKIDYKIADKVLEYFYSNNDNRSSVIADNIGIEKHFVDYIIDIHLSKKANYMGEIKNSRSKPKKIKIKVYDAMTGDLIGCYKSLNEAASELNLSYSSLCKAMMHLQSKVINHSKINKKYEYVRC